MLKKILLALVLIVINFSLSAKSFEIHESNSVNKISLLTIEEVTNYFRFNINVMQSNNWKFRRDIYIESENIKEKIKADFIGNTIKFTLTEKQFIDLMEGEFLHIKTYLNYADSFYIPNFRNMEAYEKLKVEKYKNEFKDNLH